MPPPNFISCKLGRQDILLTVNEEAAKAGSAFKRITSTKNDNNNRERNRDNDEGNQPRYVCNFLSSFRIDFPVTAIALDIKFLLSHRKLFRLN